MRTRVVVLGAGFGGLELTTILLEAFGDAIDLVLVEDSEAFVFGFSKLDVMFGRQLPADAHHAYRDFVKPGVRCLGTAVRSIDPAAKRVVTDGDTFDADFLIVVLGADLHPAATPGLVEGGNDSCTVAGAQTLRALLPCCEQGPAIVGVTSRAFKCPPAPRKAALLLHACLAARGRRAHMEVSLVMPFDRPIPPSPATSDAILAAFTERGIRLAKDRLVTALDPARKVAVLDDVSEMPYPLFLGVPPHRVPKVVAESGLADTHWVTADRQALQTRFPGVDAVGDVTGVGTQKAGVFAEGSAMVVAAGIIAQRRSGEAPAPCNGAGSRYGEFGNDRVGRADVDFLSGPRRRGYLSGAGGGAGRRDDALWLEPDPAVVRAGVEYEGLSRDRAEPSLESSRLELARRRVPPFLVCMVCRRPRQLPRSR